MTLSQGPVAYGHGKPAFSKEAVGFDPASVRAIARAAGR
jgi:hypothetical protein